MKKWAISLILVLFLTGCSAATELERGMALRSSLLKAQAVTWDAEVTARYEDRSYTFGLNCRFDGQGNMAFTVTAPETISGIQGTVSQAGGDLRFADTALYFELLTDDQLSPITAPWILMKTLRSGYITSACEEDGLLRLSIDDSYEEDALKLDVWCSEEGLPVRGEILYDGLRILSMEVKNVVIS